MNLLSKPRYIMNISQSVVAQYQNLFGSLSRVAAV